jgi:rod shape determining protein RodA
MAMIYEEVTTGSRTRRTLTGAARILFELKLDGPLIIGLALVAVYGLIILYSASGQSLIVIYRTLGRLALGTAAMLLLAQVNPNFLRRTSPWLYAIGVLLLFVVYGVGHIGKGAQRWLDLGIIRFQPSEIMKLAVPMTVAWFLHERPLPPSYPTLLLLTGMILLPVGLVAVQPDLGTACLIAIAGALVIVMAGLSVRIMGALAVIGVAGAWAGWGFMHDYQRKRVLTFLDPQTDPLGAGYHIIQSQIAIGSGGVFGKGWMNGSQAQLEFLPERSTDFIFAVVGEEFGLLGQGLLLLLYLFVVSRALYLSTQTQDTFARLVAGSLALTFFVYVFINAGMVSGLLPVVGVPLPLVSYGGTSVVTLLAGFGILMALYSHRKLVSS